MAEPSSNDLSDLGGQAFTDPSDLSDLGGTSEHDLSDLGGVTASVDTATQTPETDKAVNQSREAMRPVVPQSEMQGVMDVVKGIPSMAKQFPELAYQGLKFQTGGPQQQAQVIANIAGQSMSQGRQLAQDVQAPVGSREWTRGTLQLGLMAAPGLELAKGLRPEIPMRPEPYEFPPAPPVQIPGTTAADVSNAMADLAVPEANAQLATDQGPPAPTTEEATAQAPQVREPISLDELRLMRERNELRLQNDIAQRMTGGTHPAVDERLGQIDQELTDIANRELQPTTQGEPSDASTITSTEGVPELEVRPQVGESAPLRQPGETAGAQGEPVATGETVAPETPEAIKAAAIRYADGTVETGTTHAEISGGHAVPRGAKDGFVTTTGRFVDADEAHQIALASKQIYGSKGGAVLAEDFPRDAEGNIELPKSAAPQSITAELSAEGGPSIRAVAERPIEAPSPGTIRGWEEATAHGDRWLDDGGDINKVVTDFRKTGKVNELEMGKMNAYLQRLQAVTNQTGDALRAAPDDPALQQAHTSAIAAEQKFTDAYKPMHTVASGSLAALQGHVPLTAEAAASHTGLTRRFGEFHGREMEPEEAVKADRLAKQAAKANVERQSANGEVYKQLDNEYGRLRTTRKAPPTIEDIGKMFSEPLKEVCET